MIDEAAASILDGVLLHYPFYEPTLPSHGKAWKHVRTILLCLARLRSLGRGLPRDLTATILSADAQLALDVLACVLHPIVKARLFKVPGRARPNSWAACGTVWRRSSYSRARATSLCCEPTLLPRRDKCSHCTITPLTRRSRKRALRATWPSRTVRRHALRCRRCRIVLPD